MKKFLLFALLTVSGIAFLASCEEGGGNSVSGEGVVINDVTWASRNVGESGKFADTPWDYGNHYSFADARKACPAGWRIPTLEEFERLVDAGSVWANSNNVSGRRFGSGGSTVFIPAAGSRTASSANVSGQDTRGNYWINGRSVYDYEPSSGSFLFNVDSGGESLYPAGGGLLSLRCVKDGSASQNIWPSQGSDKNMAKGIYVGIVGFNETLTELTPRLLTSNTSSTFRNFINGLTMKQGTGLYYAVDKTIDRMQTTVMPSDLTLASVVTFTDGYDNISIAINKEYATMEAYREAVHSRLDGAKFRGLPVPAYAIGLMGDDVVTTNDEKAFLAGLDAVANDDGDVIVVNNISELYQKFADLAKLLYNQSSSQLIRLRIPDGYSDGTKVRFTLDIATDPAKSAMYIEGVVRKNGDSRSLQNVVYKGLKSSSGATVVGAVSGYFVTFSFDGISTDSGENLPKEVVDVAKEWHSTSLSSELQVNSEFGKSSDDIVIVDSRSAVVMLVLDCTTSLGTSGFSTMKSAANHFINVLAGQVSVN